MRKRILFGGLALAIGGAALWHFARAEKGTEKGTDFFSAAENKSVPFSVPFSAEELRDTGGEIVIGGGPPPERPAASEKPNPPQLLRNDAQPSPSAAKKEQETAPAGEELYTVQNGDTLGGIAKKKYGSSAPRYVDAIAKKNSLKNPDALKLGMKLVLPDPASIGR